MTAELHKPGNRVNVLRTTGIFIAAIVATGATAWWYGDYKQDTFPTFGNPDDALDAWQDKNFQRALDKAIDSVGQKSMDEVLSGYDEMKGKDETLKWRVGLGKYLAGQLVDPVVENLPQGVRGLLESLLDKNSDQANAIQRPGTKAAQEVEKLLGEIGAGQGEGVGEFVQNNPDFIEALQEVNQALNPESDE